MIGLRLALILSALASAYGHTRGAARHYEDENASNRRLMNKDKKVKNLAGNPGGSNGGGGNSGKNGGGKNSGKNGGGNNRQPGGGGGGGGNNGNNNGNGQYVAEEHTCVPFNEDMQARASLSLSDDACRANQCGGGCCRIYHWLICDTGDEMPQLSCVCNENTRPPPTNSPTDPPTLPITSAPVVTPAPTPATTPATTPEVTSDVKDGDDLQVPPPNAAPQGQDNPAPTNPAPSNPAPSNPAQTNPATSNPAPSNPAQPPFEGGKPADSCASGSPHHNNPLFKSFNKCFGSTDCPLSTECCIHSFCFCGEPDDWTGDCVAKVQK